MLRLLICTALIASAQNVKGPESIAAKIPAETKEPAKPSERQLSETEVLKLKLATAQIEALQLKYKIADYTKEVQPIQVEQQNVAMAACESIGIPAEKVPTHCGLNFATVGPDGKPAIPRVWLSKPLDK